MLKRLFILMAFLLLSSSRLFQTTMKFSNFGKKKGWIYLDKMSFAPGTVQYKLKTSPKGIPFGSGGQVTLQAIPQHLWESQLKRKCQDIPKRPYLSHRITVSQSAMDYSRDSFVIQQTSLYYFVLKDCSKSLSSDYQNRNLILNIQLTLLNNGRQVGQEEDHWYVLPVVFMAGAWLIWFYNGKLKGLDFKTQWHKMIMFGGIATQISSLTWKVFGFIIYSYTGSDFMFFHLIYLFMHAVSESLVIGLIVLIGFGWTINFINSRDTDIYVPILCCLAFLNAILTLLTRISSSEHDMHHIFDNVSGYVVVGFRILIAIIFFIAIGFTYNQSRSKVKTFIIVFAIVGGLYICALPLIILIGNNFIAAKDRHQFVFIAMELLKCVTNIGLSIMLNNQKSYYNEISYEKRSFLPEDSKYF